MQKDDFHLIAVTLTLNPVYARTYTNIKQYNLLKELLNRKFKQKRCTFIVEYTKNNDLHVHGVIESKGRSDRSTIVSINNTLRGCQELGYRCLKKIELLSGWICYCQEDFNITGDLLGQSPILRDDLKYYSDYQAEYTGRVYKEYIEQREEYFDKLEPPLQSVNLVDTFLNFPPAEAPLEPRVFGTNEVNDY